MSPAQELHCQWAGCTKTFMDPLDLYVCFLIPEQRYWRIFRTTAQTNISDVKLRIIYAWHVPGETVTPKLQNEIISPAIFEFTFLSNLILASVERASNVLRTWKSMKRLVLLEVFGWQQTHADDSVLLPNLPTPAPSPLHHTISKHSRSGSTASSGEITSLPSPYSVASHPLSSNSSQGYYSPDSQFAQAAYDATLPAAGHWGVGGYVETVNPQYTSKKRGIEQVSNFFEDVKRHKINATYDHGILSYITLSNF